ncbi:MAG TPA: hypothetical protein VMS08_02020, partial [Candidatus Saccharimonadia bacterium]|nr:hypothetical protein [Candidatus Saccharimonadia bacterium]
SHRTLGIILGVVFLIVGFIGWIHLPYGTILSSFPADLHGLFHTVLYLILVGLTAWAGYAIGKAVSRAYHARFYYSGE